MITPPAAEPVDLDRMKAHCRVEGTDEDDLIPVYIAAARAAVEAYTRRRLVTQQLKLLCPGFGGCIELPCAPVQTVDRITYLDADGDEQELDEALWRLVRSGGPVRIVPADGATWPITSGGVDAVGVEFTAGYGNASAVPADLVIAVLLIAGQFYENREDAVAGLSVIPLPMGARDLMKPHIFWV